MRIIFIILTLFFLFFGVSPVFAVDSPILISPSNNTVVTSSKQEWQAPSYELYPTNHYRVQVDNDSNFSPSSSIYRDTYKTTTTYTPVLTYGTWYWRVKAKNSDGIWSDWSTTWSFTLQTNASSPSPTSSPTSTPTPIPDPTNSPNLNTFSISNTPTQINSDQSFATLVNLSLSDKPNTTFYLKGAFKKVDSSNYFGLTKVSGNWVKNNSGYSNQLSITTDSSGNWSGNLEGMVDSDDSGYTGTGDYIFKVAKYDPLTWSNEVTIHINNVENTQDPSPTQSSSSKTTVSPTPATSAVLSKSSPSISPSKSIKIASVAGMSKSATSSTSSASSTSANIKVTDKKQINIFVLMGIIFIIGGVGSLGYILYRNETVYKLFRRRD